MAVAQYNGLEPRITSTFRSVAEQRRLYRAYLAGRHPLPVAPPGRSMHNYGLAIDLVARNLERLGAWWRSIGGIWGGPSDPVHFSVRIG